MQFTLKRIDSETIQDFRTQVFSIALLLASNITVYFDYWSGEVIFNGKDLLTAFGPLLNFQTDCLQDRSLPLWNPFLNFGYPFVEHYSNTMFFPTHLLMGLFTGSTILLIQREMLFWIFLGGTGAYLCAREKGLSAYAGIAAGMSYMFCGQMISLPHWHLLVYNAACFPFLVLGYMRAVRTGRYLSPVSILFLAFSIFGGHITTTVLGIYVFAAYVIIDSLMRRQPVFGLKFLALTCTVAFLIALPKLGPLAAAMKSGPRMLAPESLHTKDPYNTVGLYQFMSYLMPVKYFFSVYIGQLGIIAMIWAAIRKKLKIDSMLLLFVLTAWLLMVDSEGNVSLLRSISNFLPVMKLVRNEWFEWFYPSLFAILWLAGSVDQFLKDKLDRTVVMAAAIYAAALSVVFFAGFNTELYSGSYGMHIVLAVLFAVLLLIPEKRDIRLIGAAVLLTAEFALVFSSVRIDEPQVQKDRYVRTAVVDQGSFRRSYMEGNERHGGFYAVSVQDHLRPGVGESRDWPVMHSGLGGDPTYNLYPEQFARFIDDMNLKRFSGWWYNGQERYDFIRLKDSPVLSAMEGQPLFMMLDQSGSAAGQVRFENISCSGFDFAVNNSAPGMFLLNQMYDDRWHVTIDGIEARILKANEFFMGTEVGPGMHMVSFRFRDRIYYLSVALSLSVLLGLFGFMGFSYIRRRSSVTVA